MNQSWTRRSEYTPDQRAALLAELRKGRETQKGFAQRHGIKWTTFRNWLYPRTNKKPAKTPLRLQEIPNYYATLYGGVTETSLELAWQYSAGIPLRRSF